MSKITASSITGLNGAAPTFTNGAVVTGVITATTLSGNATGLTGTPNISVGIVTVTTLNATTITATNYTGIPASSDWRDTSLF